MRDGECFIRFFKERGKVSIRFMLSQLVADPEDKKSTSAKVSISSGIETSVNDIEEVKAYWYKNKRIPAEEIMHIKILVDSDVKRGRSLLEPIIDYLWMYRDWLKDRMKLNKVRATVALIKKVTGTPTQTANIKSANETTTKTNPDGTAKQKAPVGVSVFTTNKNVDYELKSPNLQASDVQHDGRTLILAISAGVGLPEFMVSCFDDKTEILTPKGFIKYSEWNKEKIGTLNRKTNQIEYLYPEKSYEYDYEGEMIKVKSNNIDLLVTPNHKMYCRTYINGNYRLEDAQFITKGYRRFMTSIMPTQNICLNQSNFFLPNVELEGSKKNKQTGIREIDGDIWASFLGWFISEGCCYNGKARRNGDYDVQISQKNKENRNIIRAVLNRMPFNYREDKHQTTFRIGDKGLWTWLINNCGSRSETRKIPNINFTYVQKELLLEALILGDGMRFRKHFLYTTASYILANQVQIMGYELGWQTKLFGPMGPYGYGKEKIYRVGLYALKESRAFPKHCKRVDYKGKVWCFSNKNKTLIVRRNGRISITGNSDASNGNYASTMVAEGPAVMEFEDWQDFFALYFSEMFEKVIKAGIEADKIPKTEIKITKTTEKDKDGNVKLIEKKEFVDTLTECSIIFPDIAVRDIQKETAAIILQWREELCSKHTARAKLDLDYEDEEDFLMQEAEEEPDDGSPTKDDEDEMDKEPEDEKPES